MAVAEKQSCVELPNLLTCIAKPEQKRNNLITLMKKHHLNKHYVFYKVDH